MTKYPPKKGRFRSYYHVYFDSPISGLERKAVARAIEQGLIDRGFGGFCYYQKGLMDVLKDVRDLEVFIDSIMDSVHAVEFIKTMLTDCHISFRDITVDEGIGNVRIVLIKDVESLDVHSLLHNSTHEWKTYFIVKFITPLICSEWIGLAGAVEQQFTEDGINGYVFGTQPLFKELKFKNQTLISMDGLVTDGSDTTRVINSIRSALKNLSIECSDITFE